MEEILSHPISRKSPALRWQTNARQYRARFRLALFVLCMVLAGITAGITTSVQADPGVPGSTPTLVNINSADVTALAEGLQGIGQSRAVEIVRHRELYGPFASPDELMEVKGIGQATLEQNRHIITLE